MAVGALAAEFEEVAPAVDDAIFGVDGLEQLEEFGFGDVTRLERVAQEGFEREFERGDPHLEAFGCTCGVVRGGFGGCGVGGCGHAAVHRVGQQYGF